MKKLNLKALVFCLLFLSFMMLFGNARATQNPIVLYNFDGNASDSSGNGKNATLNGSPTLVTGKIGSAITLNGSNQWVIMPTGIVSTLNAFTIAAWVKLNS